MGQQQVRFTLNGEDTEVGVADAGRPLLEVLRTTLGLTGTKSGCATGYCGACTVLVDGEAVPACLLMIGLVAGRDVRTVEGLATGQRLDAVQQAYLERAGFQCGFCTPGHLMATRALLDKAAAPTDEQIASTVDGNFCRCTGYVKILDSVRHAAELNAGGTVGHA
ncbi:MAG TPA: (2Fe-2S)-binding protein [Actinophytocola sp.]|jgi:aerobic-type carbon monoxide dehydrogenase small subunit (CoxS/CutS family)|uniref:(2Fe-2S)-binding protein n=1 Tax=Actinophytocola sp. TaxID=1872138 RepID=UPI002F9504D7